MGRLQIVLSDDAEKRLRDTIYKVRGSWKKGYISEAVEEAVYDWIAKHKSTSKGARRREEP